MCRYPQIVAIERKKNEEVRKTNYPFVIKENDIEQTDIGWFREEFKNLNDKGFEIRITDILKKIRMNDTVYKIFYRFFDNTDEVQLLSEDEKSVYFIFVEKFKDNIKLFNDLHLEVLE